MPISAGLVVLELENKNTIAILKNSHKGFLSLRKAIPFFSFSDWRKICHLCFFVSTKDRTLRISIKANFDRSCSAAIFWIVLCNCLYYSGIFNV